jgi:hypothetical protein
LHYKMTPAQKANAHFSPEVGSSLQPA